ncbi:hypothetical protein VD0004_g8739 [Verticillium dahliae]|nr:hypothetical protein VD0004_g8739 [Verticillium dahliae]
MTESQESHKAIARWTSRVIPAILAGVLGYATYVVVSRLCIEYLSKERGETGTAIAVSILYILFLFLSLVTYIRTIWTINTDTGLVPLGPEAQRARTGAEKSISKGGKRSGRRADDLESQPYQPGPDQDPDSPGLERFYSKNAFICENDGRPKWCSECRNWKPDRAHHSSEIGRCVLKMDHYCPWVGGMVSETSFKFFSQFTCYCAAMCAVVLSTAAYCLARQQQEGRSLDGQIVAVIALSAFFGLFTFTMTTTSWYYVFLNVTNIDMLKKAWVYQVAVRVPRGTPSSQHFSTVTYPLPKHSETPSSQSSGGTILPTSSAPHSGGQQLSARDLAATRTFAILRTEPDENPWDLGWKENWKQVMGNSIIDWLLPIRKSPCALHENADSDYPMGRVLQSLAKRNRIPTLADEEGILTEMYEFRESSPLMGTRSPKSQFTYRQLSLLASYAVSSPLRVIAHIDLDAFYAQCEMVRLNTPEDQPLAVQQWQGLIAINYPARSFGIGRHCTLAEARKLCPDLIAQHVATWREGDDKWAYRDDAAANITSDKVSLDPYRLQSRRILALIKETLPSDLQKVEKASIDEVFCDLSAHVHSILLERFPELNNPPPYDDPTERLPRPPVVALDWQADALIDLDEDAENQDPDWDDVAILIGSEIIRGVRARIHEVLHYTCSAGIANNKMLSKLGSAHKKPNQQTVIRNRAIQQFLSDFKFTKIRNLGGKLGDTIVNTFNTDTVKDLLPTPLDQMKARLGDETGIWVYNTIRGIDQSEVNSRTQIKSMLSAKSFRPSIHTPDQGNRWLRIFVADIFSRLVEEGVLENKRRPKTINLHHRHDGQMKSRQGPIPQGNPIDEQGLFDLARNLLQQIAAEGKVWPCENLSLSVGGFEDGITGNMGIGAFLVKGVEAQALRQASNTSTHMSPSEAPAAKKRRLASDGGIHRFLTRSVSTDEDVAAHDAAMTEGSKSSDDKQQRLTTGATSPRIKDAGEIETNDSNPWALPVHLCSRCNASFQDSDDFQSHQDWHIAKDLQDEERGKSAFVQTPPSASHAAGPRKAATSAKRGGRSGKLEHGQRKLKFG